MQRRALLAGVAGSATLLAGCNADALSSRTPPDVYNPTGQATVRPLEEPFLRHGLTAETERYLHARLFHPGDSLAVTDDPDAADFAEAVEDLAENEFAILTNVRVAGAAPAYLWPTPTGTRWRDGRLVIDLERQSLDADTDADEVVGIAITIFEVDGDLPDGADLVLPGGATLSVGQSAG